MLSVPDHDMIVECDLKSIRRRLQLTRHDDVFP